MIDKAISSHIVDPSWSKSLASHFGRCAPLNYSLFCWTNQRFSTLVSTRRHPREVEYVVTWKKRRRRKKDSHVLQPLKPTEERTLLSNDTPFWFQKFLKSSFDRSAVQKKLGKRSRVRKQKTFVVHQIFMASWESVLCGTFLLLHCVNKLGTNTKLISQLT